MRGRPVVDPRTGRPGLGTVIACATPLDASILDTVPSVWWFYFRSVGDGFVGRLRTVLYAEMGIGLSIGPAPALHAVGRLRNLAA
jgi:hypothetical protein